MTCAMGDMLKDAFGFVRGDLQEHLASDVHLLSDKAAKSAQSVGHRFCCLGRICQRRSGDLGRWTQRLRELLATTRRCCSGMAEEKRNPHSLRARTSVGLRVPEQQIESHQNPQVRR